MTDGNNAANFGTDTLGWSNCRWKDHIKVNLTAIECKDVHTFETEQGSRTGHSAHAVSRLASVCAQAASAVLPRNDAMDVTRLQFLTVLVPLQHRLWHSDNLNSKCTPAIVGS